MVSERKVWDIMRRNGEESEKMKNERKALKKNTKEECVDGIRSDDVGEANV